MTQTRSDLPSFDFQLWSPPHLDSLGSFSDDLIKQFDSKRSLIREEVLKSIPGEDLSKPTQDPPPPPSTTDDDEEEDEDEDENMNIPQQETKESLSDTPEEPKPQDEEEEEREDRNDKEDSIPQDNQSEQVVNIDDVEDDDDQTQHQEETTRRKLSPVSTKEVDMPSEQQLLPSASQTSPTSSMSPSSSLMMQARPETKSLLRKSSAFLRQKLFKKEEEIPPIPMTGNFGHFPPKPLQYSPAAPSADSLSTSVSGKNQHRISLPSAVKPTNMSEERRGSEPTHPERQQKRRSFFRHFLPK
ncbi:hypothetical protein DFQ28_000860 [Apophysomyces sp. BC1034]|nr:hypothetical protein DFQ29_000571 [Apophysomyces sp. BC1021]KAG0183811.1 hypothetical protein DFQ28_000860 [Apophysomyces sp. BC1034]